MGKCCVALNLTIRTNHFILAGYLDLTATHFKVAGKNFSTVDNLGSAHGFCKFVFRIRILDDKSFVTSNHSDGEVEKYSDAHLLANFLYLDGTSLHALDVAYGLYLQGRCGLH